MKKNEAAETDLPECKRRKEDTIEFKLRRIGTIIGSCIAIGGAITWAGSTMFSTKTDVGAIEEKLTRVNDLTRDRVIYCEKDILVIKEKLNAIQEGQSEQSQMLREIRDDLRRK